MKPRVLFVDDDPRVLTALERMLRRQRHAWDLAFASTAEKAREEIARQTPDAIVLDVRLPDTDGLELLRYLRSREPTATVPVVLLTGVYEDDLKRRALDLGATDLLSKPVQPDELVARIRSVLRLKAQQDQLRELNTELRRLVQERTAELERSRYDIIWRLAKASEYRDEETGNHVVRVACYSLTVAEALGLSTELTESLFLTSPLHDIGKIGIPDQILLKPGPLTDRERQVMEQHCAIGAEILLEPPKGIIPYLAWRRLNFSPENLARENPILTTAASIALCHHERWDGTGYPRHLRGEEIPLEARITGLADVYDALRSRRPYKPAFPEEKAARIIAEEGAAHFGPDLAAIFPKVRAEFASIRTHFDDPHPDDILHTRPGERHQPQDQPPQAIPDTPSDTPATHPQEGAP